MYWYIRFGSVILPKRMPQQNHGTAVRSRFVETVNGRLDMDHLSDSLVQKKKITISGIYATSDGNVRTQYDALLAMRGKLAKLWRQDADNNWYWLLARLVSVSNARSLDQYSNYIDVAAEFEPVSTKWHGYRNGAGWQINDGVSQINNGLQFNQPDETETVSPGANNITITNNGNVVVNDAIITYSAAIATDTVTINAGGDQISYTGTVAAGNDLVIDCGAMTVKNNGSDDYDNLSVPSTRTHWLPLEPGDNAVTVTISYVPISSDTSEILFDFYEGWA